jgi:FAD-dependent urate hydroxylase
VSEKMGVAIVGAGPYGLSLGAHLRAAGVSIRQFGTPMRLWRESMPRGMFLKSQGIASNLSSPDGQHTLEAFCAMNGRPYASYGLPVPLETFVAYGQWFCGELLPDLEETNVIDIVRSGGRFLLTLDTAEVVSAENVVIAAGVEHFPVLPEPLRALPSSLCTHTSAHDDLSVFAGRRIAVLGAGQSALESAALAYECGAEVSLIARKPALAWNGEPLPPDRPLLSRMREPEAGLGSGWATWFYSTQPELFRHLPGGIRVTRARTALGPAGACWLPPRVIDRFATYLGTMLVAARPSGDALSLSLLGPDGTRRELVVDHLLAGTGYRPDLDRLRFLNENVRRSIRTITKAPVVDRDYESSVPGLYFIGPAVASTFGPVMRFVYGSDHAARTASRRLTSVASRRSRIVTGAGG